MSDTSKPTYEELERRLTKAQAEIAALRSPASSDIGAEKQFWGKEDFLGAVLETTIEGFWILDSRGRIQTANKAFCTLLGFDRDEIIGMSMDQIGTNDTPFDVTERISRVMANGSEKFETCYRRKDGSSIPVEISVTYLNEPQGALVCFCHDLTERKRKQERIALMGKMLNAAPASITIHDTRGRFVYANQATLTLHGFESMEEFLAVNLFDLDSPESAALLEERFRQIAQHGQVRFEVTHRRKDGSTFPLEVMANATEWEGRPAVLSIATDITERKRAERALRESEERYRALVMQSADCLILHDMDARIVDVNLRACKTYGYAREELMQMRARDLDPDYVERAEKGAFFDGMNPGEVTRFEARQKSKDGRTFPVDVRLSKVSFGGETFIQALCTDITERKQAERERDKLREQLSQAQKMESVGRLAGGVAHDFNNMLFVILGHAEFAIKELPTGSPLHQQLQAIHKAASHSAELTSQLLAFARKQPVTRKILDVNETVSSTLKLLKRLIGEGICLEWRPGEDIGPVHVDPAQIEQVLTNLVVNARDAIGSAGKIVIETRQVGLEPEPLGPGEGANPAHYVEIAVSDNGSGMDEATQKKIFDPFFTTKEVGKGTGLGLATIYGIITQNKGFIKVDSQPGRGSTFRIHLPVHAQARTKSLEPQVPALDTDHHKETVLLVEDEPAILDLASTMLARLGYEVIAAASPREAIRSAQSHEGEIHLLLTDVVMPEMNGRDLTKRLVALYPKLKSVFMSGYTADVIAEQGILNEGVCFIAKPFSLPELKAKLREAMDERD